MCLATIWFRALDEYPVLVAINREESYERQGTPPQVHAAEPAFVAGTDRQAGGTWLGVNQHGVLAAVTNRPKRNVPARPRSRGLLCRDLLACETARAAHQYAIEQVQSRPYAGCNLLCIDVAGAYVLHAGDWLSSRMLPPGLHALGSGDVDDLDDPRVAFLLDRLAPMVGSRRAAWLPALQQALSSHQPVPPICLHGDRRGTLSCSIIAFGRDPGSARWFHSQGPPCSALLADCSHLLQQLFTTARAGDKRQ